MVVRLVSRDLPVISDLKLIFSLCVKGMWSDIKLFGALFEEIKLQIKLKLSTVQ